MANLLPVGLLSVLLLITCHAVSEDDQERGRAALPDIDYKEFGYGIANYITRANLKHIEKNLVPDDIIISSYPKSGTNWIKQIVHMIRLRGSEEKAKKYADKDLSELINIPEAIANFDFSAWQDTPKGARYIYVVRDFVDIVPSFFKYVSTFGGNFPNHTVNDAAKLMMNGVLYCGAWETHVASFFAQRSNPNVLLVKYEDLKNDHAGQVARMAKFLKFDLTPKEVADVVATSTFAYMKKLEAKIQGKDWAESVTGQSVSKDYTLVSTGGNARGVLDKDMVETLKGHFHAIAAVELGMPSTYEDFLSIGHDEL